MKHNYTHISMVLDRSGSMSSIAGDTRGGVNTFIKGHQAAPGECTFTLNQFDNVIDKINSQVQIAKAQLLNEHNYVPRAMTALNDAVAMTIIQTGDHLAGLPEAQRPEKVIFVIVTDGQENASREYGGPDGQRRVLEMIKHQEETYKWEFVFIGANQDAFQAGAAMGIGHGKTINYSANAVGTAALYSSLTDNSVQMRSGAKATMDWEDKDRKAQTDAGAQP